ncbi:MULTISPECIES: mycothiol transferase [Tsukamurella]|uniref:Chorismate synthase n=2 Tax=Tsukamurella TaxID=2060 RepID=A0A138AI24_9ACTN|nr:MULTISPECIES: DUF664 domain-containing protein [Tsukamurella]KXO98562.1 hypothetical protein AXK61_02955 [Tsukamurella pseudospumae]KXP10123.1 hypothetical protein AXK60_06450 [Tsukamurella pseudospumae]NKY18479.1 DUF664 domain-containing protein [Tsukamurella spumae]
MDDATAARDLLIDSFARIAEHAEAVTDGLTADIADRRIVPDANTIAWLVWHSARVIDAQLAPIAGVEQVWTAQDWFGRFGLDLPADSTGYGHTRVEAAQVHGSDALLIGYFRDVDAMARTYLTDVTPDELARVIDEAWDPPVTVAVRLVSIVDDCAQHLGAAAYLKGALESTI